MAGVERRPPPLSGGYESLYLRAVDPRRPRALWLRHTVHRAPGADPLGSIWVTLFDRDAPAPVAHKVTLPDPQAPPDGWLRIGDSEFGPAGVRGPGWDVRFTGAEPVLRHLPMDWMYRAPLPKTKLTSPLPAARFDGHVEAGGTRFDLDGWTGMVGHNWGSQHAERWIWLHGALFEDVEDGWLDLAIGRVRIGPATTPWIVNGVVSVAGRRTRISGRPRQVREDPLRLDLEAGPLALTVHSPRAATVVYRYADPDGSEHHTANCSVATIDGVLTPREGPPLRLHTAHGGAYELGMRETTHALPVQPFSDP